MNKNSEVTEITVSSSECTKKHLLDNKPDTCWVSSHAKNQYIELKLDAYVDQVRITFQPGFQPTEACMTSHDFKTGFLVGPGESMKVVDIRRPVHDLRIEFLGSHDLYGRICIYSIELF